MLYKNIIFIHIPKTGGNSFQKELILNKNYEGSITVAGNQDGFNTFGIKDKYTERKHQNLSIYNTKVDINSYNIVTIVREPTERLVSLYFSPHRMIKYKKGFSFLSKIMNLKSKLFFKITDDKFILEDFKRFISNVETQSSFLKIKDSIYNKITILKFENYNKECAKFFEKNNLKFQGIKINGKIMKHDFADLIKNNDLYKVINSTYHSEDYRNFYQNKNLIWGKDI